MKSSKAPPGRRSKNSDEPLAELNDSATAVQSGVHDVVPIPALTFSDYRAYLQGIIRANRHLRGFQSRLADAARCTSSFLTQVLRGEASLSLDHFFRITRFLKLSDEEWLYLRELLLQEKCSFVDAQQDSARLAAAFRQKGRVPEHNGATSNGKESDAARPSRPKVQRTADTSGVVFPLLHWDVFHVIGIPGCSTTQGIADKLGRPVPLIRSILQEWEATGFVGCEEDGTWYCTAERFGASARHLAYISSLYKQRIVTRLLSGETDESSQFACLRLKAEDVAEIRQKFADALAFGWQRATAREEDGDTVVYVSYDLEPIGKRK